MRTAISIIWMFISGSLLVGGFERRALSDMDRGDISLLTFAAITFASSIGLMRKRRWAVVLLLFSSIFLLAVSAWSTVLIIQVNRPSDRFSAVPLLVAVPVCTFAIISLIALVRRRDWR
jgi:hypothetical protein